MRFSDSFTAVYDVKSVLGEGGMGRVLLAEDRQLKRLVAIKLIAEFDDGPDGLMRQRFIEEARVCAGLKHPNVVRMFTSGFEDGKPYMVFEYIEGQDVGRRIEQGPLPEGEALAIAEATLAGLQYAHDHQVIHRDIKPANILLRADGVAMLMDFGVAKAQSGRTFKTQTNLILGTPLYMAPELIRREDLGPGVDVYALGCTLYEMLTGKPPYTGKSDVVVLEMHMHAQPEPIRTLRPELSEDVELLIDRAMQKDVAKRFQTAKEMSGWIDTIRTGGRVPRSRTLPQMPAPPGRSTRPDLVPPNRPGRPQPSSRSAPSRAIRPASTKILADTPALSGGRGRRRTGILVGAMLCAALAGYGWHYRGGLPVDVRLAFGPKGLAVAWRTAHATRGAVFHRAQEGAGSGNADGTLDRRPVHAQLTRTDEAAEATEHRVLVPGLRAGDLVVVSLPGPSGESAWARAVLVPPSPFAKQVPAAPGATTTRVVAQTGRVSAVMLEARPADGDMLPVKPVMPDLAELTFEVPLAPELLVESSCVRAEQMPGVTLELPVRTMHGHAQRLAEALERAAPASVIAQVVQDKRFDRNGDFDNMLGETPMYDGMPKSVAKRQAPEGYFKERINLLLQPSGVLEALAEFGPHADAWFAAATVSDELKLQMYERLLSLEQLDQLIRGQLDAAHQFGFARHYEQLVRARYTLPQEGVPIPEPPHGAVLITPGAYGWVSHDYQSWDFLTAWGKDYQVYRGMGGGQPPSEEEIHTRWAWRREFPLAQVPGAGGPGTAHLRGIMCVMGPNYFLDVSFSGRKVPFHVRISQPATPEFRKVMDDAGSMLKIPPHAEFELTFPARLLPADTPLKVDVQYRLLPVAASTSIQALARGAMTRDLSLLVK